MRAGPLEITRDATVAEMDQHGNPTNVLRAGSNEWICVPYAYLHICGTPWDGNEYHPNDRVTRTLTYVRP